MHGRWTTGDRVLLDTAKHGVPRRALWRCCTPAGTATIWPT